LPLFTELPRRDVLGKWASGLWGSRKSSFRRCRFSETRTAPVLLAQVLPDRTPCIGPATSPEDDLAWERQLKDYVHGPEHPEDVRRELETARAKQQLLKRLPKLKADKHLPGFDARTILWEVMENADPVAKGGVIPEDLVEEISIPGVPEGTDWEEYGGWTAGAVRAGIEAIASATDEDPEELLEVATARVSSNLIAAKAAVDRVEQDLEKMSRERLLPDEKTLEKVARYEAHLSRGLYKALHELEALQTRRLGGSAPLARLDVQGLES
jgi:hypothetical protein